MKKLLEWISEETRIDTVNHPTEEVWVEIHKNPETQEEICISIDTSGCDSGIIKIGSYKECCNVIGELYGYNELWKKIE